MTRKVGQALVKTHLFDKAITYYKAAIKTNGHVTLRYDLAFLLFRMKRHQDSKDVIAAALDKIAHDVQDLTNLEWESRLKYLLAQVQLAVDSSELAVSTLVDAHATHGRLMRRIPIEQPDLWPEQKAFEAK